MRCFLTHMEKRGGQEQWAFTCETCAENDEEKLLRAESGDKCALASEKVAELRKSEKSSSENSPHHELAALFFHLELYLHLDTFS